MKLTKRIIFYIINFIVILMVTTNSVLPAKLYNYKKEKAEFVNDKLVDEKILSNTHSFIKGTTVHLLDDEGEIYNVPAKNAHEAIQAGYRFIGEKIVQEYRKAEDKELFMKKFRKKYRKKGIAGTGWFYHAVDQDMLSLEDRSYMTLKAEKVEFNLDEEGVLPTLKNLKVLGGVRIENGNNLSVTGKNAYYSVLEQTVVIEGEVKIDNGFSIIKGDKLILDLVTGKAEIVDDRNTDSRIKGIFKEE